MGRLSVVVQVSINNDNSGIAQAVKVVLDGKEVDHKMSFFHSSLQKIQDGSYKELLIFPKGNHICGLEGAISSHFFMILSTLVKVLIIQHQLCRLLHFPAKNITFKR